MTIDSKLIKYSASCSAFGDWAIAIGLNISKSQTPKRGDIVLFDFNKNGTSDHAGIVTGTNGNTIYTVEGNTSVDSDDNGGCVMKRTRTKSQINYFVRSEYDSKITAEMVVQTALAEVGTKESPKNSNNVKYNTWFYGRQVKGDAYPWCMVFVSWCFAHVVEISTRKYTGTFPVLPSGKTVADFALSQKGTYSWRGKKHKKYSNKFTRYFAGKYGIDSKGQFPRYKNDIAGDCDLFAFGYCLHETGNPQTTIMKAMGKTYWWWTSNLYRYLKQKGKITHTPVAGAIAFYSKGTVATHTCLVYSVSGNKVTTVDKNGKYVKKYTRNKKLYLGYYVPKFKTYLSYGDEGKQVKRLQLFLNWAGYRTGTANGVFGNTTKEAVERFQYHNGLTVDGQFGSKSLAKAKEIKR